MKNVVMYGEAVGHLTVSKIVDDNKQTKLSMAWSIDMAFMYMYVTVKERIVQYTQTEGWSTFRKNDLARGSQVCTHL